MVGTFRHRAEGWGERLLLTYRAGRTAVCHDVDADPTISAEEAGVISDAGFRAYVAVPLVKQGKYVAVLAVHSIAPRNWTPGDVALVEQTAERTWVAVEKARAEAALRELNDTLEARIAKAMAERKVLADVFEGTDAMISVVDTELRLLAFNRPYADEVEKLGGYRPHVGDHLSILYVAIPELAEPVEANWRRAVSGEVFVVTEEHGDPDRYRRCYERRFEPIHDRDGRLMGAYQYATDVTERLRDQHRADTAEAGRRASDARYRAYFQNSGEALFVVGVLPDGGFTFEDVNPAHKVALGFDVAAEPGLRVEEVLPAEVAQPVVANYRRVIETGELQRYRETAEMGGASSTPRRCSSPCATRPGASCRSWARDGT
jgi:PAS domain-containing protein